MIPYTVYKTKSPPQLPSFGTSNHHSPTFPNIIFCCLWYLQTHVLLLLRQGHWRFLNRARRRWRLCRSNAAVVVSQSRTNVGGGRRALAAMSQWVKCDTRDIVRNFAGCVFFSWSFIWKNKLIYIIQKTKNTKYEEPNLQKMKGPFKAQFMIPRKKGLPFCKNWAPANGCHHPLWASPNRLEFLLQLVLCLAKPWPYRW